MTSSARIFTHMLDMLHLMLIVIVIEGVWSMIGKRDHQEEERG